MAFTEILLLSGTLSESIICICYMDRGEIMISWQELTIDVFVEAIKHCVSTDIWGC